MNSRRPSGTLPAPAIDSVSITDLAAAPIGRDQRPVLVTGIEPTPEPWSPDLIAERVGSTEVPVREIIGGDYISSTQRSMTVRDYLRAIDDPEPGAADPLSGRTTVRRLLPRARETTS